MSIFAYRNKFFNDFFSHVSNKCDGVDVNHRC